MIGRLFFLIVVVLVGVFLWKNDFDFSIITEKVQSVSEKFADKEFQIRKNDLKDQKEKLEQKLAELQETFETKKNEGSTKLQDILEAIEITKGAFEDVQKALDILESSPDEEISFESASADTQTTKEVLKLTQKNVQQTQKTLQTTLQELETIQSQLEGNSSPSLFSFFSDTSASVVETQDQAQGVQVTEQTLQALQQTLQELQQSNQEKDEILKNLQEKLVICG